MWRLDVVNWSKSTSSEDANPICEAAALLGKSPCRAVFETTLSAECRCLGSTVKRLFEVGLDAGKGIGACFESWGWRILKRSRGRLK